MDAVLVRKAANMITTVADLEQVEKVEGAGAGSLLEFLQNHPLLLSVDDTERVTVVLGRGQ